MCKTVTLLLVLIAGFTQGAVSLPYVFTHHMVLQRGMPAPVWGKAAAGEQVTVAFGDQKAEALADESGRWRVTLDPLTVGEPRQLTVSGSETPEPVVVRDVLVGDVWICSGQSNMQWNLQNTKDGALDLLAADRPQIRLLQVNQLGSQEPLDDIDQAWKVCSPASARSFSAVGYHFGTQLQETLKIPVGLIRNAWGGSACDAWVPLDQLEGKELYTKTLAGWKKEESKHDEAALRSQHAADFAAFYEARNAAYEAGKPLPARPWVENKLFHQHRPANLFNGRVMPLVPFAIKGVIWYQGESNANRAYQYRDLFPLTIQSWRDAWGQGDFPFYWVQLADFKAEAKSPESSPWAELREAQTMTLDRLPKVGEAVTIDIGESNDIHPRNKRDVGLRLARLALARTYGKKVKGASPRFDSVKIDQSDAIVTLSNVGQGLKTYDGTPPTGFTIAGADQVFHPATAKIVEKNRVAVTSPKVAEPVAVRYAWAWNPVVNLYDSAWLPVTPFRTDDWPGVTRNAQ